MISEKAKRFKKAYRLEWKLSSQKEAFVKLLFESLGFKVVPYGLGVMEERTKNTVGSRPDFKILDSQGNVLFYVEVTGDNFYRKGKEKYITYDKVKKYRFIKEPVLFIYLGLKDGKLVEACFTDLRSVLKYAANRMYHRYKETKWGTIEHFVYIPEFEWKPLNELAHELKTMRSE